MSSALTETAKAQIDGWSRSTDRELCVFALLQASHQVSDLPLAFLDELAGRFAADADPVLSSLSRELTAATAVRRDREAERGHPGTVLSGLPAPALTPLGGVDAKGRPLFEEAALYWLTPLLDQLHEALEVKTLPQARVIEALGRLGWRGSVSVLKSAATEPSSAEALVEALARIGGDEAGAKLIDCANSSTFPARIAALGRLGVCTQPKAGGVLAGAMRRPDPATRRQVARALARSPLPEARSLLPKLLSDLDDIAVEAAASMGVQREPLFGAHLVSLGEKTKSARVRATVVATLAEFYGPQVAVYVRNAAQDKDARVRANAVESAGKFLVNPGVAKEFYRSLLADSNHRVAANAVVGLFPLDETAALERLDLMLANTDPKVRAAGCWAAGRAVSPAAKQRLARSLERETDSKVLQAALRAIEGAGFRSTLDSISRLAVFPKAGVRGLAAKALARVGGLSAVPALAAMLSGESEAAVRREVVEALSEVPRMEALSYLPDLLSDPSEGVVLGAVRALAATGTLEAASHLRPLCSSGSAPVRGAAIVALVSLGDLEVIEELLRSFENKKTAEATLSTICAVGDLLTVKGLIKNPSLPPALLSYHAQTVMKHEMRRPKVAAEQFAPAKPNLKNTTSRGLPKIEIDLEKIIGTAPWEPQPAKPAPPKPADPFARPIGSGVFAKKELAAAIADLVPPPAAPEEPPPPPPAATPDPAPAAAMKSSVIPRPVVSALASMPSIPRPGKSKAAKPGDASPLASLPNAPRGEKPGLNFSALDEVLEEEDDLDELLAFPDDLGTTTQDVPSRIPIPEPEPPPAPKPAAVAPAPVAVPKPVAAPKPAAAPASSSHALLEGLLRRIYADPATALPEARDHLSRHPSDPLARYLTLKARLTADRKVKLEELRQLASPGQSDMLAVPFQMARIFKEVKRPADAATWYLDLMGIELAALERVRNEALQMASRGHVDEAQRLVAYLASVVPMRPRFHAEIGEACTKAGLHELAFHHLHRAHLSFPEDHLLALKLARAAQQVGEIDFCRDLVEHLDVATLPAEEQESLTELRRALVQSA